MKMIRKEVSEKEYKTLLNLNIPGMKLSTEYFYEVPVDKYPTTEPLPDVAPQIEFSKPALTEEAPKGKCGSTQFLRRDGVKKSRKRLQKSHTLLQAFNVINGEFGRSGKRWINRAKLTAALVEQMEVDPSRAASYITHLRNMECLVVK